jgi:CMP-N-acetylneuraminic acid synthetase
MTVKGKKVIAVVPARSGSKGVARKNMRLLGGVPLVTHTLRAAIGANRVDETWLTSECDQILSFGKTEGVFCIKRPDDLATDQASAVSVLEHFLSHQPKPVLLQDPVIVYMQPTSPLRTARHVDEALELFEAPGVESLMSVVANDHSPYKFFRIDGGGLLQSLFEESLSNVRRQDLPETFRPNGAIYAFTYSAFVSRRGFPSNGATPFFMDAESSIDIDTIEDLFLAERTMGAKHG